MSEVMSSIRRRVREYQKTHREGPEVVRLDEATYGKLLDEIEAAKPFHRLELIFGVRIEVVDAPEWLEVR